MALLLAAFVPPFRASSRSAARSSTPFGWCDLLHAILYACTLHSLLRAVLVASLPSTVPSISTRAAWRLCDAAARVALFLTATGYLSFNFCHANAWNDDIFVN